MSERTETQTAKSAPSGCSPASAAKQKDAAHPDRSPDESLRFDVSLYHFAEIRLKFKTHPEAVKAFEILRRNGAMITASPEDR